MGKKTDSFQEAREEMVETQIAARGVTDERVLEAMRMVPREKFVPAGERERAYADGPLPIASRQTISQPYVVAFMTEKLGLLGEETVLEIGSGCGYQTAILARLCRRVFAIEYFEELADTAREIWGELGIENIALRVGDGCPGWAEEAPFDAILAAAAAPSVPQVWIDQLKEGGRMILPVGTTSQSLILVEKRPDGIRQTDLMAVRFVPLLEASES